MGKNNIFKFINKKEKEFTILPSDYCIDSTIKCGFEHGFRIIVPAYANTTVNYKFMTGEEIYKYYNDFI